VPLTDGDKRCSCGAGCATFGECMRNKSFQITGPDHMHFVKRNRVLGRYEAARREGIQPQSPMTRHVAHAVERSQRDGVAYRA
jgi:hypothetical protein